LSGVGRKGKDEGKLRSGVVAVIVRGDRFLVIRRADHVEAPGAFCFPGGAVEPGETEPQTLCRELAEELGVEVEPVACVWRSVTAWQVSLAWWTAMLGENAQVRPNASEVASAHWLTANELRVTADLLSSNHEFLDAIDRGEVVIG